MTESKRPRLAPHGFATIYCIVPPGKFNEEYKHVNRVLSRRAVGNPDGRSGIISEAPEVLYLLGQARFAARVEALDYRTVLERAYPDRDSHALVSNAVFSIPYVRETRKKPAHGNRDRGMIRFLTHLRVRRTVYAVNPVEAEALILGKLQELVDVLDGETSIEAGLGWADFLISGVTPPNKFNEFLSRLVEFNRVCIDPAIGGDDFVFKRSLTLLGYGWTGAHQAPVVEQKLRALMFIRAKPGRLSEVESLLTKAFPETDVAFVDGKIDVIASMRSEKRPDFFAQHEKLSEETGLASIEKFETHVIFGHDLFRARKDTVDHGAVDRGGCGCVEKLQHPKYDVDRLPPSLANAVKNMEFLFSSTTHDGANCCDARTAILACEESLKRLLHTQMLSKIEMNTAAEDVQAGRDEQAAVLQANDTVVENLYRIDRWVRTSERILRQRTVGSFEEFLGQSDRAVSYRGGAQKVLTVADNLMNDLYARLAGLQEPEPFLTSLYDSVDRIQHVVGTGLVRMPVRALFFLPGVVPDLWHEVGGFHFFRTITAAELKLDLTKPMDRVVYYDLADHYGDLVSFLYGFKLDVEQFATALIEGWLVSQPYATVPEAARQPSYVQIVARIVAVSEFLLQQTDPIAAAMKRKAVLTVLYEDACEIATEYGSSKIPVPSDLIRRAVLEVLESDELNHGLPVLRGKLDKDDVADAVKALDMQVPEARLDFNGPADLPSFTADDDLNDHFRALYWAVMQERRITGKRPHAFAFTAALTRGAALEYHRRAAARML